MSKYNSTILAHIIGFTIGGVILGQIANYEYAITLTVGIIGGYLVRVLSEHFQKKVNFKVKVKNFGVPTRITFDGRKIKYSNLEHQHLSNIYWFNTIHHGREHDYDGALLVEIDERFKGEILSYKPLKEFTGEIEELRRLGFVEKKDGKEVIFYKGKEVGKII